MVYDDISFYRCLYGFILLWAGVSRPALCLLIGVFMGPVLWSSWVFLLPESLLVLKYPYQFLKLSQIPRINGHTLINPLLFKLTGILLPQRMLWLLEIWNWSIMLSCSLWCSPEPGWTLCIFCGKDDNGNCSVGEAKRWIRSFLRDLARWRGNDRNWFNGLAPASIKVY